MSFKVKSKNKAEVLIDRINKKRTYLYCMRDKFEVVVDDVFDDLIKDVREVVR